ncbi:MAG: spore maturation protein [Verrucomicrobiae bacterium]|nr:spore maturation protein [Verrucomicrobiae bacterium]
MLNWIWMGMIVVGVVVAALMGQLSGPNGIVEGLFKAVKSGVVDIVLPLSAVMMFWLGMMRLAEKSGLVLVLARIVRPLMRRLFPEVPADHPAMGAMVMNLAANMLGLGNAATPLGLKAMQHLDELNSSKGTATNSMCTFLAMNTSSVTLIPATAIGLLAARGIPNPTAIVSTTILASLFATLVAIVSVKIFEKLPVFNRVSVDDAPAEGKESAATSEIPEQRRLSPRAVALLAVVGLLFVGVVCLETFPERRAAIQNWMGLSDAVAHLNAAKQSLSETASANADPGWKRFISALSIVAIPFLLVFFLVYAALRRIRVYEEFVEGAKEGWAVAVRIMPFIVAMLAALAILRNSGAMYLFQEMLRPALAVVHFPPELVPMALMRPLSGSGSQGVLVEILMNDGLTDLIKYTAATMFGSTETTFYVLAVYFGSVAVRRTRHALLAGLCADAAGLIGAVVICRFLVG